MRIITPNYSFNVINNRQKHYNKNENFSQNTSISPVASRAVSFGNSSAKVAQTILNNESLRTKFITFLSEMFTVPNKKGLTALKEYAEYATAAALAVFGAAFGKQEANCPIENDIKSQSDNIIEIPDFFKILMDQNAETNVPTDEPKVEENSIPSENKVLEEDTTLGDIVEQHVEEENDLSVQIVVENEDVLPKSQELPDKKEGLIEEELNQEELQVVQFPKKHGRLSKQQEELKSVVLGLSFPKHIAQKLEKILSILVLNKIYITKSGESVKCDDLNYILASRLKSDYDNDYATINKCYDILELGEKQEENKGTGDANSELSPAASEDESSDAEQPRHAPTSYQEIKDNPIQLNVVGKIELPNIGKKNSRTDFGLKGDEHVDSVLMQPEDSENVAATKRRRVGKSGDNSLVEAMPQDDSNVFAYQTRPQNTRENPRLYYIFNTPAVARNNNIFAIPPYNYSERYVEWEKAGGFAYLMEEFKAHTRTDKENYDNLVDFIRKMFSEQHSEMDKEYLSALNLGLRWSSTSIIASHVQIKDLNFELQKNKYNNIEKELDIESKSGINRSNSFLLSEIVDVINAPENQKYFKHFSRHAALRFIERYIITADDIREQCEVMLPMLFKMIERNLAEGAGVSTHLSDNPQIKKSKDGVEYIMEVCNPNVRIVPNKEEAKYFGSQAIILGIGEYQKFGNYDNKRLEPVIITIESETPHNLLERIKN